MAQPYKVKSEGAIDYILAGVKGVVAGYAGGQAARKQAEQMLFDNQLKLDQLTLQKDQMKQQWDMWQEDTNNRWKELLATQKFTETQAKMNQGFQKEMYKMQLGADITMKVADWQIENHKNKMNMSWDIFKTNLQDANEKKRIEISEREAKSRLLAEEADRSLRLAQLGISKEGLAIDKLGLFLRAGETSETKVSDKERRMQMSLLSQERLNNNYASIKAAYDKSEGKDPQLALSYSQASIQKAAIQSEIDRLQGQPFTLTSNQRVVIPKDRYDNKTEITSGKIVDISYGEYLKTFASSAEEDYVKRPDTPDVVQPEAKSNSAGDYVMEQLVPGSTAKKNSVTEKPKMYPMKPVTKKTAIAERKSGGAGRSWGEPVNKEAQDYIDYVKSKGYKSISELPEVDIKELKSRGIYEEVKRGW